MIIHVGSTNPSKISAVEEVIEEYEFLKDAKVVPCNVSSGVRDQPMSLAEITLGARNRANEAKKLGKCSVSIGIESGLIKVPKQDAYIDLCVVAVKNRGHYFYGTSPGFQIPREVTRLVLRGKNLTDASYKAKLTTNPRIGAAEGLIGIVTKGRVSRSDYTVMALKMAFVGFENEEHYYEKR